MRRVAAIALGAVLLAGLAAACSARPKADIVIGKPKAPTTTAAAVATIVTVPPPDIGRRPIPEPRPARGLKGANGRPYGTIAFRSDVPVPGDLVFILVAGSDARPREDIRRTR